MSGCRWREHVCRRRISGPRFRHRSGQGRANSSAARATSATSRPGVIQEMREGRFEATDRFDRLDEADAIIICVPTPLTEAREPDLTYRRQLGRADRRPAAPRPARRSGEHDLSRAPRARWCCRSSKSGGLQAGRDFFLAFSPEREDPGNATFSAPHHSQGRRRHWMRRASSWPPRSMTRSSSRSSRSPAPRWPRRARSWRTPTAPSTSPSSTS